MYLRMVKHSVTVVPTAAHIVTAVPSVSQLYLKEHLVSWPICTYGSTKCHSCMPTVLPDVRTVAHSVKGYTYSSTYSVTAVSMVAHNVTASIHCFTVVPNIEHSVMVRLYLR